MEAIKRNLSPDTYIEKLVFKLNTTLFAIPIIHLEVITELNSRYIINIDKSDQYINFLYIYNKQIIPIIKLLDCSHKSSTLLIINYADNVLGILTDSLQNKISIEQSQLISVAEKNIISDTYNHNTVNIQCINVNNLIEYVKNFIIGTKSN